MLLTRHDWLETSLKVLAAEGLQAVTVDRLATLLEVTRGSFYHHFRDKDDLFAEMLSYWASKWTVGLLADITSLDLDAKQSLRSLMQWSRHRQAMAFDTAIRAWAMHDPISREVAAEVDEIRLEFVQKQFRALGFKGVEMENRSRLFLYYMSFETAFFYPIDQGREKAVENCRLELLTSTQNGNAATT